MIIDDHRFPTSWNLVTASYGPRQAKRGATAPFLQRPMSETVLVILNRPCPKQLLACDGFKSFMIFMFIPRYSKIFQDIPRYSKIFQGKFRMDMNGFTGIHCFPENSIEPMAGGSSCLAACKSGQAPDPGRCFWCYPVAPRSESAHWGKGCWIPW